MTSPHLLKAPALLVLLALAGSPLLAGVVFQVETTYHSGSGSGRGPEDSQMSVEGKNLKMEIQSGNGEARDEAIFRGDRRQMVAVDHREKTYMVIDGEAVKNLGGQVQGQMQQAMKELEKQLEGLDPKTRERMEKMLKGQMGQMGQMGGPTGTAPQRPAIEIRATGERANHRGYPCVRYDVVRGEDKVQELWVTDWSNVRGSQEVAGAFREMASFYGELMDSFEDMMGSGLGGFFAADSNPMASFSKIDGFPVVTRTFEGGELESETVLESVTERDLDPDAFEPPKGYRLRTMGPQ